MVVDTLPELGVLWVSFLGDVFMVFVSRKEKNARHFAWLLIALLVFRNLILCVCVIVSVWSSCGISLISFRRWVEPFTMVMVVA